MRRFGGLKLSLAFIACVLGSALASGPAAAQAPPDPQTANVPYLAWRGEQIRLVKCDPAISTEGNTVDWSVEEWTGPGLTPTIESSTLKRFDDCVAIDVVSLDPGLARIKLVVSDPSGSPILKHQFLAIWLSLQDPAIDEVGVSDPTGDRTLGDPPGDGVFTAGDTNGRIQVKVQGTFPHPLGPGGSFTLPDDWAALAEAVANDSTPDATDDVGRWDIHDDTTKFSKHVPGYCTTQVDPTTTQDAVDNCNTPSTDTGPFSRVFGAAFAAAPVIGPFDPLVINTLLSDGNLNADDAPMPAARVDVEIAKNTGGSDIGGIGSLAPADKTAVYSRNGNGSATAHNYYAPFYSAYIPATARGTHSSGVDGPTTGNDFPGFLVPGGLYQYWDFARVLRSATATPTNCLLRNDRDPTYRQTPSGPQNVAVYTDEHGEAQVQYVPGTGAYYNNLGVRNDNGGCDLQDVDLLGTASITATARYPYQAVSDTAKTSVPLHKEVHSLFTKFLSYYLKGPGEENSTSRIVVAEAHDVDGSPFANERVCFFIDDEADGAFGFSGTTGKPGARFTVGGTDALLLGNAPVCRFTDANGRAAVEVLNSDPQKIDVIAYFVPEGILRHIDVDFGTTTTPDPPPTNGGHGVAKGGAGTDAPSAKDARKVGAPTGGVVPKKVKFWIASRHLVKRGGKVYLLLKVRTKSKIQIARHTSVRIKVLGKHGRKLSTKTKRIRTNRLIKLRLSAKARKVRVSLVR